MEGAGLYRCVDGGRHRGVLACLLEVASKRLLKYDSENFYMYNPIYPLMP